jgi:hypothetical protein
MSKVNVRKIHGDCWNGVLNEEWAIDQASSADFDHALERLDACTYTMLVIEGDDEQYLIIGGGSSQYVVCATFDNEESWNLLSAEAMPGTVLLNVGGQEGDYPAVQVVNMEQARTAGRVFLDTLQLDSTQKWKKQ